MEDADLPGPPASPVGGAAVARPDRAAWPPLSRAASRASGRLLEVAGGGVVPRLRQAGRDPYLLRAGPQHGAVAATSGGVMRRRSPVVTFWM